MENGRPDPADPVGHRARDPGADGRTEQRRRDRETRLVGADREMPLNARHRAVDHGAVIAEQKSAHRGARRDENHIPGMPLAVRNHRRRFHRGHAQNEITFHRTKPSGVGVIRPNV
jgi:hypothetical protein